MSALLKLLMTSSVVAGALRAKLRAARRTAGVVAALATAALIASSVGVAGLAAAAFFALRPEMQDYQAALVVAVAFIILAAIAAFVAAARLRRIFGAGAAAPAVADASATEDVAQARSGRHGEDPLVRLISASIQSPVVMSALALGILAGRATKRSRRG